MEVKLSCRDRLWYLGIPYDYYDEDPEKWNNVIEMFDAKISEMYSIYENDKTTWELLHLLQDRLDNTYFYLQFKVLKRLTRRSNMMPTMKNISTLPRTKRYWTCDNDFDNDKRVIINYHSGSGGNFLLNCLYFNDSSGCISFLDDPCNGRWRSRDPEATITSKEHFLSVLTLDNIEEKLNCVISKTKNQSIWTDPLLLLNLHQQYHKILITKFHMWTTDKNPRGDVKKTLLLTLELYPNCKTIIHFKNTKLFRHLREYNNYKLGFYSQKDDSTNLTILQFIKKSQEKKKKIIDLCNDETQLYSFCNIDSKITFYMWDTNWFFSEGDTIDHIRELYELLSLPGFNDDAISKYYNAWIETMSDLKEKNTSIKH